MIIDPATVDRNVSLDADVCIVGSGAGGAMVARELAAAGRSVVVVEAGAYVRPHDFTQREEQMLERLYAERGTTTALDSTVVVAMGRVVGGSTVPGLCVCTRPPRAVLQHWARAFGLGSLRPAEMEPVLRLAETRSHVVPMTATDVNANNAKLRDAAQRLGWRWRLLSHNRIQCLGCGFCALGCAYDRKADALTVHLRAAVEHGAVVVPQCRVERVEVNSGAVTGVQARFTRGNQDSEYGLTVRSSTVVLAAGAIGSPALWLRSGLPNRAQQVGRHLRVHPQVVVAGVFAEDVNVWQGIPQSVVVEEFLDGESAEAGGYWLNAFTAHPIVAAALLPGIGPPFQGLMREYRRLAVFSVTLNERSTGRVTIDEAGRANITYHLGDEDRLDLLDGIKRAAELHFTGGATRVLLPFNELVDLTKRAEYRALDDYPFRANDPLLLGYHPQGTLRMGRDPARSVVGEYGAAHGVAGLYVADASVFPTSTVAPPQLAVMAFALRTAHHILAAGAGAAPTATR